MQAQDSSLQNCFSEEAELGVSFKGQVSSSAPAAITDTTDGRLLNNRS